MKITYEKKTKQKLTKDKNYPHILSHHSMPSQPSSVLAPTCPTLTVTASNFPNPFATNIVHPMQTHSQSGIFKPKQCFKVSIDYNVIQLPYLGDSSKYPKWL